MLSIIVPCLNEEASIPLFYEEMLKMLAQLNAQAEFIFVDDGSKDNTLSVLREIAEKDECVHYISLSRNFGKEAAMLAGLHKACGQFAVTMDADMQDPPSLIPQMLEAVASGEYDCAGTRRVSRKGEPFIRSFFARRFYAVMKLFSDIEIVDGARDFRLMNKAYLDALLTLQERNRFSKGIFPWLGFKTKWFEYENVERTAGHTKWSFWNLLWYSFDGIVAFSSKPLAIASILGILLFLVSISLIIFIVVRKIMWGDPVDGWASTICIILFCSGVQLFSVGVLGQYMAKTYTEVKCRPNYLIREQQ
ncbi:MAG: glycosyltransferase family 2 protein [Fibromonadales bacterium]|nr:glycosyltransferase family 2 protein [Fibromonadales bacterium]